MCRGYVGALVDFTELPRAVWFGVVAPRRACAAPQQTPAVSQSVHCCHIQLPSLSGLTAAPGKGGSSTHQQTRVNSAQHTTQYSTAPTWLCCVFACWDSRCSYLLHLLHECFQVMMPRAAAG